MHERQTMYNQLVKDEIDAERKARAVSDAIRARYRVADDGTVSGLPTDADLRLEAQSWGKVHELRGRRYAIVGVQVPSDTVRVVADIAPFDDAAKLRRYSRVTSKLQIASNAFLPLAASD